MLQWTLFAFAYCDFQNLHGKYCFGPFADARSFIWALVGEAKYAAPQLTYHHSPQINMWM
jgi:hypothetical protein